MHTILLICAGLVLLRLFWWIGQTNGRGFAPLLPIYLGVWAACAAINGWIGVTRAGYPVLTEGLVFLPVFGVPALAAVLLARWS